MPPFLHPNARRCDFGGARCDLADNMTLGQKRGNQMVWKGRKDKHAAMRISLLLVFP